MTLSEPSAPVGGAWPGGTIPVAYGTGVPVGEIEKALELWESASQGRISFVRRTTQRDFAKFLTAMSPRSYIGFLGRTQPIYIPPGDKFGTVLHEVGHLLGLHHEHTRRDRDQYIVVHPTAASSSEEAKELERRYSRFDDSRPYDYASVMHYPAKVGGKEIITAKQVGAKIGLRAKPSAGDLASLAILYG